MAKSKKVVLIIVEGSTEAVSFSVIQKLNEDRNIYFQIIRGDIASDYSVNMTNIVKRIYEQVQQCMQKYHFYKKDILQIVHIVDTDGVYICEKNIEYSPEERITYTLECIRTKDVEAIKERNKRKSAILNRLYNTMEIANIPYSVYYLSSNLEHVLHDKQNATKDEKIIFAEKFQDEYYNKPKEFLKFIRDSDFCVKKDYMLSWEYIKKESNSLKRYTNFNIFLTR